MCSDKECVCWVAIMVDTVAVDWSLRYTKLGVDYRTLFGPGYCVAQAGRQYLLDE